MAHLSWSSAKTKETTRQFENRVLSATHRNREMRLATSHAVKNEGEMSRIDQTRNGRTVGKLLLRHFSCVCCVYVCLYVGHMYTFLLSICSIGGCNLFCSQELYPWLSSEMLVKNVARKQVWWLNHSHLLDQWARLWFAKHVFSQTDSLVAIHTK